MDAGTLPRTLRSRLRPGVAFPDGRGGEACLPRYFYRVASWQEAKDTALAPSFGLYEFMRVDLREDPHVRAWPRYVPCAVAVLAAHLSILRLTLGTYVHVAANGAYRSPAHALATGPDAAHAWGTSAQIYRIGDDLLCDEKTVEKYRALVQELLPAVYVRPYGHGEGESDDHLHLSLGTLTVE